MNNEYYIIYNPYTYNLMNKLGQCKTPLDLFCYVRNIDKIEINEGNYLDYLDLDLRKQRLGFIETFAFESYGMYYVANQIANLSKSPVIMSDDKRRPLSRIIKENGKPKAVFITTQSSNFPTAVIQIISLNYGKIPTIIGGIHVSSSPEDISSYIKPYVPYPHLVSQVVGAGDSDVIKNILEDLESSIIQPAYNGKLTMENKVWGNKQVKTLPPAKIELLNKFPIIGKLISGRTRINPIAPFVGCPYSCNFCSISSIPKKMRKLHMREPDDIIAELKAFQAKGETLNNRYFFFLPDNILLGGKRLETLLDKIISNNLKINYAAQISIDVANNERLLRKLRLSGASHFLIGFESLDIRNLEFVNKHIVHDIAKSGQSVNEYYTDKIKIIQKYGININAAFIFGLPYDYFNTMNDHTGKHIAKFCIDNHISLQPTALTDLPGSLNFQESVKQIRLLYGLPGSMEYLLSLCIADLTEGNRIPPDSLYKSTLVIEYMMYDTITKVGSITNAIKSGMYMAGKAFNSPTAKGRDSIIERMYDSYFSFFSQLVLSQFKEMGDGIAYTREGIPGTFARLWEAEKNTQVKTLFSSYVKKFN